VAGQSPPGESYNETGNGIPFYQGKTEFGEMFIGNPTTWTTDPQRFAEAGNILISVRAPVGPVNLATQRICIGRGLAAIKPAEGKLMSSYVFYFLRSQEEHIKGDAGAVFAAINREAIEKLQIPLPPLDVQKEIVAEIEGYQKVIDGARIVLDNYRPHIPIHPDWPMVPLSDVACAKNGFAFKSEEYVSEGLRVMRIKNVQKGRVIDDDPKFIALDRAKEFAEFSLKAGDILMSLTGNVGRVGKLEREHEPAILNQRVAHIEIKAKDQIHPAFLFAILDSDKFEDAAIQAASGVAQANLSSKWVEGYEIPLPLLTTQQAIVAEIEAEQGLVAANRELIGRFEKKIQATLARVWGEDKSTPAVA